MWNHPKFLILAATIGIVIMGLSGWWIGTLGQPQTEDPPTAVTELPPEPLPPIIADLKKDWSNTNNPNPQPGGTWSYNQDATPLTKIDRWASGEVSGWGPAANRPGDFLPFMFQAPIDGSLADDRLGHDFKTGDIIIHATDPSNSAREGHATISWKSASAGTARVTGSLWPIRNLDRDNDWQLILRTDGTMQTLASGTIPEGGPITRDNPTLIECGPFPLHKDDTLQLLIFRNHLSPYGDFTAANLTITITPENTAATTSRPGTTSSDNAPTPPTQRPSTAVLNPYVVLSLVFSLTALVLTILTFTGVIILFLRQRSTPKS